MALSQPRLEFARAPIKQLDQLLTDYSSLKLTNDDKDAIKTAIAALIQTIQTTNSAETDPAVWIAALETLKTDASTEVQDGIDSIESIKAEIIADPAGYNGTTYDCAQCQGLGKIQSTVDKTLVGIDPGIDDAIYVTCPLCKGDGITEVAYEAVYDPSVIPDYNPI